MSLGCTCFVLLCIVKSTVASPGRGTQPEEVFSGEVTEDLPHHLDPEQKTGGDRTGCLSQEHLPPIPRFPPHPSNFPFQSRNPDVTLPPFPPISPFYTHFPFPPVPDCHLTGSDRTPGRARKSVLSCPTSRGFACSPSTPSIPVPQLDSTTLTRLTALCCQLSVGTTIVSHLHSPCQLAGPAFSPAIHLSTTGQQREQHRPPESGCK